MRIGMRMLQTAALSCLLLAGTPSARGVASGGDLFSPAGLDGAPTVLAGTGCLGFVTGGGSIPAGGGVGSFWFHAGNKDGFIYALFQYTDEGTGMLVKGLSCTAFDSGPSDACRHFAGEAAIDGIGGFTYTVDVCDNAEPGNGVDSFAVTLSNGYSQGGILASGNIQLHPCH